MKVELKIDEWLYITDFLEDLVGNDSFRESLKNSSRINGKTISKFFLG